MLLDGSDDVYQGSDSGDYSSSDRYKYTQKNEIILMSKKIQCDCLIFISQLELDGRSELYLAKLKKEFEQQQLQNQEREAQKKAGLGDVPADEKIADLKDNESEKENNQSKMMSSKSKSGRQPAATSVHEQNNIEFLDTVATMKGFEHEIGEIYICILFDLMLYKYNELNYTAFELLIKFFNRKASLLECLSNIQILENKKSIDILNKVKVFTTQLKIYMNEADMFMNESDKQSRETKTRIGEIFSQLTRYCSHQTSNNSELVDTLATRLKI